MANYQITHIRVSDNNATSTEKITHVKILANDPAYTVNDIIGLIQQGHQFFYTTTPYQTTKSFIEVATSSLGNKYIRTKANYTTRDNLLSLPRF
ncbi:DUF3892 domain-containing protein [Lactococcus lactis]|uniref:DUF3892 domain-containing protein n=1 Tax=Lactococcus lactis subsp. lactis TaxID=1360 RepID=A0A2Z3KJT7_LACLL|nr:DUF3892 domain-containing protein [Lactococcus lactis]AWN66981.1 DUF3892 domain-containing protein [Lactococcus lactis subsp. lactis]WKF73628.1 DUF3892 domain-containing protein [Lactococcus lactis]